MAVTSWPAAASSRRNRDPVKELPPVKRIFMAMMLVSNGHGEVPGRIEVAIAAVLVRDHGRRAGPLDRESRVVPADAALALRRVELVHEVERLDVVGERE